MALLIREKRIPPKSHLIQQARPKREESEREGALLTEHPGLSEINEQPRVESFSLGRLRRRRRRQGRSTSARDDEVDEEMAALTPSSLSASASRDNDGWDPCGAAPLKWGGPAFGCAVPVTDMRGPLHGAVVGGLRSGVRICLQLPPFD
jgi:hypothetical protein